MACDPQIKKLLLVNKELSEIEVEISPAFLVNRQHTSNMASHTQSQRYLSTRGGSYDVREDFYFLTSLQGHRAWKETPTLAPTPSRASPQCAGSKT
jgi:hypothetical protein